jgi:hypothetical protein
VGKSILQKPTGAGHRGRKFFTFWERGVTFRKFLPEVQFSVISKSIKTLNSILRNISNMEKS